MRPKWIDARNMNTIVTREIAVELNDPMDRFLEENPPVAHTLKAWQIASNNGIPQIRKLINADTQMPMNTHAKMETVLFTLV